MTETGITLSIHDMEYAGHGGDAGLCLKIICPECNDPVTVAQYPWWKAVCDCGRRWTIVAVGKKNEEAA